MAVKLPNVEEDEFRASLVELERLVNTLGYDVVARVTQARDGLSPAAVLGEGKLMELAKLCGGSGAASSSTPRAAIARSTALACGVPGSGVRNASTSSPSSVANRLVAST